MECEVQECGNTRWARGWCQNHYQRWRKYGSPLGKATRRTTEERFWNKVVQNGDCWEWTGSLRNGYGAFRVIGGRDGVTVGCHRWAYEFMVGEIPDGLHLDHLCRNRACVNPEHLDPVPQAVNNQRSRAGEVNRARLAGATHCQRGHPFDEVNTRITTNGFRQCKACHKAAVYAGRARRRQAQMEAA